MTFLTDDEFEFYKSKYYQLSIEEILKLLPNSIIVDEFINIQEFIDKCRASNVDDWEDPVYDLAYNTINCADIVKNDTKVFYVSNGLKNPVEYSFCKNADRLKYSLFNIMCTNKECADVLKATWRYDESNYRVKLLERASEKLKEYDNYTLEKFAQDGFDNL